MSRKRFIQFHGGTCRNWQWSWSFVNEAKRFVIFGAWDINEKGRLQKIFDEAWQANWRGRRPLGYDQSREHIRLVEENGYRLMTFPMKWEKFEEEGPPKIGGFKPELTEKKLLKIGNAWYADSFDNSEYTMPEELPASGQFWEGAKAEVTVNAYERNPKARAACIAHHGCKCAACGFNFEKKYGEIGKGRIHVHHVTPIGKIGRQYEIDPKTDLIPVCPNCHFVIHLSEPPLTIEQVRDLLH
jgi:5-methylcytosine-specific restriction enzyme A